MPELFGPFILETAEESAARLRRAIIERCTCEAGKHDLTEPHDPDCSLQNTGYLS